MHVKRIYVRNFRNLQEASIDFSEQINEVIGNNAQGKTSLLEALYLSMTGTSFRTMHLKELIRHGEKGFFIETLFEKQGIHHVLSISYDGTKRRVSLNSCPCESSSILIGLIQGVTCTPEDHYLVKGSPALRRRFLDLQIAQVDPLFVHHLSRYMRALKQRNNLLKKRQLSTISVWEYELSQSAAYIAVKRKETINQLCPFAKQFFTELITGKELAPVMLDLSYTTQGPVHEGIEACRHFYQEAYSKKRVQEVAYGNTLVGPHRDDLEILIDSRHARDFASEGQKRLSALALKLAEWHTLQKTTDDYPLMIVDDFGVSLDSERCGHFFNACKRLGQVFLSIHETLEVHQNSNIGKNSSITRTFLMQNGLIS